MKPTKKTDTTKTEIPSTADVHTLAGIFGLTPRSIQNLEKQGIAVRVGHGRYDLHLSVKRYIAHLEAEVASGDAEFEVQRTRVYKARADILEAQSEALRGELHDGACIAEVMGEGLANIRAKLLAIPTTAAPRVADETDPNKCAAIIETLLHEAMLECSKYNGREIVNRYLRRQGKLASDTAKDEVEDMEAT
jgi:phage terminase Nu1 subunit (DNA packaging protein)